MSTYGDWDGPVRKEIKRASLVDPDYRRCRSWRVRGWWVRRCTWNAAHVLTSKWHCDEWHSSYIWPVPERARRRADRHWSPRR